MSRVFKATVKENKKISSNHYLLTLHPLKKTIRPHPGQFFMISVGNGLDPLLRRPFSLYRWLGRDFQILYRIVGKGTRILRDKKVEETIDVMGPFGNGFPLNDIKNESVIIVAGGLGIVPLFSLTEATKEKRPFLFYGAKTKNELLCLNELKFMGITPLISTEDGTAGRKGIITELFIEFIGNLSKPVTDLILYSCGPRPMLKAISDISKRYKLTGYISLEENMACGIGACLGCVINTTDGYKCVCKEGPVFSTKDIIW